MSPIAKLVSLAAVAAAVGGAVVARTGTKASEQASAPAPAAGRPRLVDLGADKCIPCREMAPILAELGAEYAGQLDVEFIDVWRDPAAAEPYAVHLIPTQIFFGADGRELARHEGFMPKADILARWKALGIELRGRPR